LDERSRGSRHFRTEQVGEELRRAIKGEDGKKKRKGSDKFRDPVAGAIGGKTQKEGL